MSRGARETHFCYTFSVTEKADSAQNRLLIRDGKARIKMER